MQNNISVKISVRIGIGTHLGRAIPSNYPLLICSVLLDCSGNIRQVYRLGEMKDERESRRA